MRKLTAMATLMNRTRTWPAVMLPSHSKHMLQARTLQPLPNYTGLVRVYAAGQPPCTWLAVQGTLVEEVAK